MARFYLNKVLYAEYKEAHSNPIPSISSLKLDEAAQTGEKFKTPVRPKKKPISMASRMAALKEESGSSSAAPVKKSAMTTPVKVEKIFQLAKPSFGAKKGKLAIFDDENKLPKPKITQKRRAKKKPVAEEEVEEAEEHNPKVRVFLCFESKNCESW